MNLRNFVALAGAVALVACGEQAQSPLAPTAPREAGSGAAVMVSSSADAGAGSLRAAIEVANADPSVRIIHLSGAIGPIGLQTPLVYSGAQALRIHGSGTVIDANAVPDGSATPATNAALVANGGGDLTVHDLTVRGSTGVGILVDVPDAQTGTIEVTLQSVTVEGSVLHGVLVNDQVDYFADPLTRASGGSPADVRVRVTGSHFVDNGFGGLDYDGLRVNEGGAGSLFADIIGSEFIGSGADGVELDERAEGDAVFSLQHTKINANGFFSSEDYDDGIDVDELGPGGIDGRFVQVEANGNAEQGVDLKENNLGDLRVTMNQVVARGNAEEGIEFEEDDDFEDFPEESWGGDLETTLVNVTADENGANDGDAGLKVREKFDGNLTARLVNPTARENAIGGVQVREGEAGNLDAEIVGALALSNDGEGIEVRESSGGSLDARIQHAVSSSNDGAGVRLRGTGVARIQALTAVGNSDGPIVSEPGIVVTQVP